MRFQPALLVAVAAVAVAAAAAPATANHDPSTTSGPTLDGELLVAVFGKCTLPHEPGGPPVPEDPCHTDPAAPTVQAQCDPTGSSVLRYEVTGTAGFPGFSAGPYPGTFTERGTIVIGPQNLSPVPAAGTFPESLFTGSFGLNAGPLERFDATFEIQATDGTVIKGIKRLYQPTALTSYGVCAQFDAQQHPSFPSGVALTGYVSIADTADLRYSATINTPTQTFRDEGRSDAHLREHFLRYRNTPTSPLDQVASDVGLFVERFQSDGSVQAVTPGAGCGDKNHIHEQEFRCEFVR